MERYDALRAWRSIRARQRGVEPDVIFTNDQLMTIARQAPKTVEALQTLGIMGPWKLGEYGERHPTSVSLDMSRWKTSKLVPVSPLHREEQPPCN